MSENMLVWYKPEQMSHHMMHGYERFIMLFLFSLFNKVGLHYYCDYCYFKKRTLITFTASSNTQAVVLLDARSYFIYYKQAHTAQQDFFMCH